MARATEPLAVPPPLACSGSASERGPVLPMDPRQFPAPAATTAPSLVGYVDVAPTARSDCGGLVLVLLEQIVVLRRENRRLQFALAQLRRRRYAGPVPPRWSCSMAPGSQGEDD